ncbi:MAG: gliding motility-associated C-terminal domain-containing protein [Bacteroidetes bacterium]|nr:gliding motility-associated C-terminal domain-containing protein [Bacteroidota bacterium]
MSFALTVLFFSIYNRWGEKIFESSDANFQWDGTYKGKPESSAVYAYYMTATLSSGEKVTKKGNISLMR